MKCKHFLCNNIVNNSEYCYICEEKFGYTPKCYCKNVGTCNVCKKSNSTKRKEILVNYYSFYNLLEYIEESSSKICYPFFSYFERTINEYQFKEGPKIEIDYIKKVSGPELFSDKYSYPSRPAFIDIQTVDNISRLIFEKPLLKKSYKDYLYSKAFLKNKRVTQI